MTLRTAVALSTLGCMLCGCSDDNNPAPGQDQSVLFDQSSHADRGPSPDGKISTDTQTTDGDPKPADQGKAQQDVVSGPVDCATGAKLYYACADKCTTGLGADQCVLKCGSDVFDTVCAASKFAFSLLTSCAQASCYKACVTKSGGQTCEDCVHASCQQAYNTCQGKTC